MDRARLYALHHKTGELITLCNRLLIAMVTLGSLFVLMLTGTMRLAQSPEAVLATQAFCVNYIESAERESIVSTGQAQGMAHQDPNWDGGAAGFSYGMSFGRSIPVIGPLAGPVLGAMLGYRMDTRI